jgi:hypothetical protein
VQIFVNIYLCIRVLVILHNEILHKYEFGQVQCIDLLKRIPKKYFIIFQVLLYFLHIFEVYLNFWNYKRKWKIKTRTHSAGPNCGPRPSVLGPAQLGKWPACWRDTTRSPRRERARGGAVVCSPATLWQRVSYQVWPTGTSRGTGWHQAGWWSVGLIGDGQRR